MVLLITEVADPSDNWKEGRFVELYSPNGAGATIELELYLVRWVNDKANPTYLLSLRGFTIGNDGFFVVCESWRAKALYDITCSLVSGGVADSNGDDQIALVLGHPSVRYWIVDIFGVPGEDGSGTDHDFKDGHAERKSWVTAARATYDADEWEINDGGVADMGPFAWAGTGRARGLSQPETSTG